MSQHDDAGHANHLCQVVKDGVNDDYIGLVKDAKFICEGCGRTAANDKNLCAPKPL